MSKSLNQSTRAALTLRQRVLSGAYPSGTRLLEVSLAQELGISRTPIRAALAMLAEEGLIERVGARGFQVRGFAPSEVRDSIELRGLLEGACARMAAERGLSADQRAEMHALLTEMDGCFAEDALDLDRYGALNTRFHTLLATLCGSTVFARELDRVTRLPFAAPSAFLPDGAPPQGFLIEMRASHGQHWAMYDALCHGQGSRAEALAREHCRAAMHNFSQLAAARGDTDDAPMVMTLVSDS